MNDVGGSLLVVESGVTLNAASVSSNTNIRSDRTAYIDIRNGGGVINSTIAANSFVGANAGRNNYADCIAVRSGATFERVAITGNAFGRPDTACINFQTSVSKISITGNSFARFQDGQNGVGNTAIVTAGGSGVIVGNTSDLATFRTGSGSFDLTANDT